MLLRNEKVRYMVVLLIGGVCASACKHLENASLSAHQNARLVLALMLFTIRLAANESSQRLSRCKILEYLKTTQSQTQRRNSTNAAYSIPLYVSGRWCFSCQFGAIKLRRPVSRFFSAAAPVRCFARLLIVAVTLARSLRARASRERNVAFVLKMSNKSVAKCIELTCKLSIREFKMAQRRFSASRARMYSSSVDAFWTKSQAARTSASIRTILSPEAMAISARQVACESELNDVLKKV